MQKRGRVTQTNFDLAVKSLGGCILLSRLILNTAGRGDLYYRGKPVLWCFLALAF